MSRPVNSSIQVTLVLFALFCSGVAAIINQIVWQRALKVYLAGSEAISSMIVVLVFMLGLGLGSYHIGRVARRVRNPLRTLAFIEIALFLINLVICLALMLSISISANAMQQAAFTMGIPLRVMYAAVSTLILIVPCYLMGTTMPLVSEASNRQLRIVNTNFLTRLFFLNTLGAVGGAFITGFLLLPYFGQRKSLIVAFTLNLLAGALILAMRSSRAPAETGELHIASEPQAGAKRFRTADYIGFFLGFFALAYEMYLLRIGALAFEPVPTTFSKILGLYLLFWSGGLLLAPHVRISLPWTLLLTCLSILLVPHYFYYTGVANPALLLVMLLPCVLFGLAFGKIVVETTKNWGNDIGRFYFMNTVGSCLGIVVTVIAGYRTHPDFLAWIIAAGYLVLALSSRSLGSLHFGKGRIKAMVAIGVFVGAWVITSMPLIATASETFRRGGSSRAYFSPDGVVQVKGGKAMIWDGLWHSNLSFNDHVDSNNWLLGSVPYMAHPGGTEMNSLVIGLGTGVTAATLASYPQIATVHVYEINKSLEKLLNEFPAGTLNVATHPKIEIDWQDGRIGLVLNPQKYDIITQQPTYLKQAGSSMLLSREYMEMVKQRLKPDGVFCVYCNSLGNKAQAAVVRKAASEVFPYCESGGNGYMLLLSLQPINWSRYLVSAKIAALPEGSIARKEAELYGIDAFTEYFDTPRLNWDRSPYAVTDDHPLVEYPDVAARLLDPAN